MVKCSVHSCRPKHKNESVFRIPKNAQTFQKWVDAVKMATGAILAPNSYLCEKHFYAKQIVQGIEIEKADGGLLIKVSTYVHMYILLLAYSNLYFFSKKTKKAFQFCCVSTYIYIYAYIFISVQLNVLLV